MTEKDPRWAWVLAGVAAAWVFRVKLMEAWVRFQLEPALGWPYVWGNGDPGTSWADGPSGVDCSGFAQMALVKLGQLSAKAADRTADSLRSASRSIPWGEQIPGDLAFWEGHVEVVVGAPQLDGDSATIGSRDGGVKLRARTADRAGFLGFGRL
jgi:hypothetical protein